MKTCKHCDYFMNLNSDSYVDEFNVVNIDLLDKIVKLEVSSYIGSIEKGGKSIAALKTCALADCGNVWVDDKEEAIPIKYCPFCGRKLERKEK